MRLTTALLGTVLSAGHVFSASIEEPLQRRHADIHAVRRSPLNRREPQPVATSTADAAAALATWNAQAEANCMSQMMSFGGTVQNPSGMAVCYIVPFMDTNKGVFEAELRMYNISAPTQEWVGVTAQEMMVSLAYLGATVQRTNGTLMVAPNQPAKREVSEAELKARSGLEARQMMPQELKVLTYVGQLNSNIKGPQMNNTAVQNLLVPEIELSAMNPASKQMVYTILSSKQANFMGGIFATASTDTITPASLASASAVATSAAPFVIPGVDLGIFPIGLIVTMVWVGLFVGFVGAGTVGRYQFREQYRRRLKREEATGMSTI